MKPDDHDDHDDYHGLDSADDLSRLPAPPSPLAGAQLPDAVDPDDATEPTAEEIAQQIIDLESQQRLWLKAILPILQLRSPDADPSDRVQYAFDQMTIAACERASRILRTDLRPDQG
jgi:hypothetical protein